MLISFVSPFGEKRSLEIDEELPLFALFEIVAEEVKIPANELRLFDATVELQPSEDEIKTIGIHRDVVLKAERRKIDFEAEALRARIASDKSLRDQYSKAFPDLIKYAETDSLKFALEFQRIKRENIQRQKELKALERDPFNVEAQKKIEAIIKEQNVLESMRSAMENHPETFTNVNMLYIKCEVNGVQMKAFVDSGAQRTIMSPAFAEKCGIMRLLDHRFSGTAVGVGTAKIVGRVHSVQIKIGSKIFPSSFDIMEGVDFLFGLDLLKSHKALIDLGKYTLTIGDQCVPFLTGDEVPMSANSAKPLVDFQASLASIRGIVGESVSESQILSVLESCEGNVETAVELLLAE